MAPVIETRNGVKISVHSREHLPVHVHAKYAEHEALVNIRTSEVIEGSLPKKKLKIVTEWLEEEDVRDLTEQNFYELNPRLKPTEEDTEADKDQEDTNDK